MPKSRIKQIFKRSSEQIYNVSIYISEALMNTDGDLVVQIGRWMN